MDTKIPGSQGHYHALAPSENSEETAVSAPCVGKMRIPSNGEAVSVRVVASTPSSSTAAALDLITPSLKSGLLKPLRVEEVKELLANTDCDEGTWKNVGGTFDEEDFFDPRAHLLSDDSCLLAGEKIEEVSSLHKRSDIAKKTDRFGLIKPSLKIDADSDEDLSSLLPKEKQVVADDCLERFEDWNIIETEKKLNSKKYLDLSKEIDTVARCFFDNRRELVSLLSSLKKAVTEIGHSQKLLVSTSFNHFDVKRLRSEIESYCEQLIRSYSLLEKHDDTQSTPLPAKIVDLKNKVIQELHVQRDHLKLKEAALTQYLQSDPFNDKNILRPRRILAEGVRLLGEKVVCLTQQRIDALPALIQYATGHLKTNFEEELHRLPDSIDAFNKLLQDWYAHEVVIYDSADPERRSQEPQFYTRDKTRNNPIEKYDEGYFLNELKTLCSRAGIAQSTIDGLQTSMVKRSAEKAMNEVFSWNVALRDMTVSLNGETKHFRQTSEPLSQSATVVGQEVLELGIHGIVPATRADGRAPINARRTTLVELLTKKEDGTYVTELVHERQQHGIVDHFHLNEPERSQANMKSARQLIQYGMETDREFIVAQIEKRRRGDTTPAKVFYINTNLTTPTATPRDLPGKKDTHDERTYSNKQGEAFRAVAGQNKIFHVLDPDSGEIQEIAADITFIDFRFPVNYALDRLGAFDPGMKAGVFFGLSTWDQLHRHNADEFKKLFGALLPTSTITGQIGSTLNRLNDISVDETKSDQQREAAEKMRSDITRECFYVRSIFADKSYQSAKDGDRFKMPRHIDLLVNKFREATSLIGDLDTRVINAGGCMSGKDREGVANVEAEAAVMIEKMGRVNSPGHHFNDQERDIYNTSMALVVDNTLQVTGFGGSKNAHEVEERIGDPSVVEYAMGLSKKAKT